MRLRIEDNPKIYPWSSAETRANIKKAAELIQFQARRHGVKFSYDLRSGTPVITTWNVRSSQTGEFGRGSWNGSVIKLQSGIMADKRKAPFASVDALARILIHEVFHSWGYGHRSTGIMHPWANSWFDGWDINVLIQRYGRIQNGGGGKLNKKQQIAAKRREIIRLSGGIKKAQEAYRRQIKPSQDRIRKLRAEIKELRGE